MKNLSEMDKRTFNLLIDRALLPVFGGLLWSGVELHAAGHAGNPAAWHGWSVGHAVVSLLFAGLVVTHIRGHWGWYRSLKTAGCKGDRRRMVLCLTALFLLAGVTGLGLLFRGFDSGSHLGIFHWIVGLVLGFLGLLHMLRRLRLLVGATSNPNLRSGGR